jgi:hypothetical protein
MGPEELHHIIQARKNLDDVTELAQYADLYKNIGWSPVALDDLTGTDLKVDFGQPQATWLNLLLDLCLKKGGVSLAIRLKPEARLVVLKVTPAFGKEFLDGLGDWRSPCMARAGDSWENHFLVLPQTWRLSPEYLDDNEDAPLSVIGPGRVVPVPPAKNPASRQAWRWLHPPWRQPPRHPSRGLLLLLKEAGYISRRSPMPGEDLPTWEDLYPVICRSNELLQTVLTPVAATDLYYRSILYEALRAGFRDPRMLQGLLWHAPHGETRLGLEAQQQLSQWAREIQWLLSAEVLSAESGSSHAASPPGAGPAAPRGPERPRCATAPPSPENVRDELSLLATLASELEQQVHELEEQQLSAAIEPGGSSFPSQHEKSASPSLAAQQNREELEELRCALEAILAKT